MASSRRNLSRTDGSEVSQREIPAYTTTEAARYLQISRRTLHNWLHGNWYPSRTGPRRAAPVIDIADPKAHLLSFVNMLELHVLDAIRFAHGVDMRVVRRALDYLKQDLRVPHPLVDVQMETDGKRLLVRRLGGLIDAGSYGQASMADLLDIRLQRIERDASGIAVKLFLFTRRKPEQPEAAEQPRSVFIDPSIAFGRPVIVGTRVPTAEIADRYKAGDSIQHLAKEYTRAHEDIEEAIRCELRLDAA